MSSWFRVDDNITSHPKMMKAMAKVGDSAIAAWVNGMAYANRHLTDGFLPEVTVRTLTLHKKPEVVAEAMVSSGLWERAEGGFQIHDYLEWNTSRAEVEQKRETGRARTAQFRSRHRPPPPSGAPPTDSEAGNAGCNGVTCGVTNGGSNEVADAGGDAVASRDVTRARAGASTHTPSHTPAEEAERPAAASPGLNQEGLRPEAKTILDALKAHPELADVAEVRVAEANAPPLAPKPEAPTVADVVAGIDTLARHVAMGTGLQAGREWTTDAKKRAIHGYATTEAKKRRERAAEDERRPKPAPETSNDPPPEVVAALSRLNATPTKPRFERTVRGGQA